MAPGVDNGNRKNWYKISVDAVRAWTTFLLLATIVGGGFIGYRLLADHLLERSATLAIEEADSLSQSLRQERGIVAYQEKFEAAKVELVDARTHYEKDELPEALAKAERSRSLFSSIADSLRNRDPAGEAQFITTRGDVQVRRGERGEWRPARGRMVVHAGDYIKTAGNGSAEVMMVDGTLFTVRPGTIVLVDRSRNASGGRSRTISLESGWVNLSTAASTSRVTTPRAEAEVKQRTDAVVSYDESKGEGKFTSFRGGVKVASKEGGDTQELGQLEQVVQRGDEISAPRQLPDAPEIVKPEDNIELYLDGSRRLVLNWRPVKRASRYALQVSGNRLFVDNVIDTQDRVKPQATVGLRNEGTFVWRVAALDGQGEQGPWSSARRFRVFASRQASGTATAVSPTEADGE